MTIEELETSLLVDLPVAGSISKLSLLDQLLERLSSLTDFIGDLSKTDILAMLTSVYDDYVAPLDIPGVPNFVVEPRVDAMLRQAFLEMAEKVLIHAKV